MRPISAAKAVFRSTLKHWVRSRLPLAKRLRLLEHYHALQRPALQTRQHDKGETGDKALDAANTVKRYSAVWCTRSRHRTPRCTTSPNCCHVS
eukprot:6178109-Pleurochrysis_carterae.AAC.3